MYCPESTNSLLVCVNYPNIKINIDQLLSDEGCPDNLNPFLAKSEKFSVLNGDLLEKLCAAEQVRCINSSVDFLYCVTIFGEVKVQFVELKFNSKRGFYYLNKASFQKKIDGTTSILQTTDVVNDQYFIVFKDNRLEEARRFLFRTYPYLDGRFQVKSISQIADLHFF